MNDLVPVFICLVIFGAIYKSIELFVHRQERLRLIEKIAEVGSLDVSNLLDSFRRIKPQNYWSLRVACLCIGISIGYLVGLCILANILGIGNLSNDCTLQQVIYPSCICLFGGIGLLVSYIIEHKDARHEHND
jgi:hypothetical protein